MDEPRLQKDQRILRSIFPDLVWLLILQSLHEFPNALANIYNASAYLQELCRQRRSLFFFARLLERSVHSDRRRSLKIRLDNDCSSRDSPVAKPLLLKLRLVCKSWCVALDKLVQSKAYLMPTRGFTKLCIQGATDDEARFLQHFDRSHLQNLVRNRSPFIGNALILWWPGVGLDRNYPNGFNPETRPFLKVVRKYGQHVRFCRLMLLEAAAVESWFHAATVQILRRLPNLRTLDLTLSKHLNFENINRTGFFNWLTCLPPLLHLEVLHIDSGLGLAFLDNLVHKLPNLKRLTTNLSKSLGHTENVFPMASLKSLTRLDLDFGEGLHFEPQTTECQPSLQNNICAANIGLHNVYRTLEAHSPLQHLRTLSLEFPCALKSTWDDWQHYNVNLPNLQLLFITLKSWSSIDFALVFRNSLEILHVDVTSSQTLEQWSLSVEARQQIEDEHIHFLNRNGRFDKNSNIWTLMPRLRSARV